MLQATISATSAVCLDATGQKPAHTACGPQEGQHRRGEENECKAAAGGGAAAAAGGAAAEGRRGGAARGRASSPAHFLPQGLTRHASPEIGKRQCGGGPTALSIGSAQCSQCIQRVASSAVAICVMFAAMLVYAQPSPKAITIQDCAECNEICVVLVRKQVNNIRTFAYDTSCIWKWCSSCH